MSKNTPDQPTNGHLNNKAVGLLGNGTEKTPPEKTADSRPARDDFEKGQPMATGTQAAGNDSEGSENLSTLAGRDEEIITMVRAMTRESRQAAPPLRLVRDEIDNRVSDLAAEKTRDLNRIANSLAVHVHRHLANTNEENTNAWNH